MSEGSVITDSAVVEGTEEVQDNEDQAIDSDSSENAEVSQTDQAQQEPTKETKSGQEEKPQLTDEGTKLDPNPQSAAYQQLANAQRKLRAYEAVLNDPNLYQEFAGKLGKQPDKPQEITPESLASVEDVAKVLNEVRSQTLSYQQEIASLKGQLGQMTSKQYQSEVHQSLSDGIKLVREKYPELREGDQYNPDLEREIHDLYHELNYDPQTDGYSNRFPLPMVAQRIMNAYNLTKKAASQEAQTLVKQKSLGKVVTSEKSGKEAQDVSEMSIAQRIAYASKRR